MLHRRIEHLLALKDLMKSGGDAWDRICENAQYHNAWFTRQYIAKACEGICDQYLDEDALIAFASGFGTEEKQRKKVGITMAGNIPLVGFHDFMCVYLSGHSQSIRCSSKDNILLPALIQHLFDMDERNRQLIEFRSGHEKCDAYIATGSNSSAMYFEKYFAPWPHIIRKNRTSVAVLDGSETEEELSGLADDVYLYFGLGCRNVSKIFVPLEYDFVPLLTAFRKYDGVQDHSKYKNNLDYNLAVLLLNNTFYMSNGSILLVENTSAFSPISVLHYEFYTGKAEIQNPGDLQAIVGHGALAFGSSQTPSITDFADGVNTVEFLNSL